MKRIPLIALLIAVVLPATGAAAKTAYFKVRVSAGQEINWKQDQVDHTVDCGVVHLTGSGKSVLALNSGWRPITATRTPSGVTFAYSSRRPELPIGGHLERQGATQNNYVVPPPSNNQCGRPEKPVPPDCGTRPYPYGTALGLVWDTPRSWPKNAAGPKPKAPSLHLTGPNLPQLGMGLPFQNCVGESLDYELGINAYPAPNTNDGFAPLPLSTIFGKRKQFQVHGSLDIHTRHPALPQISGTWDTETAVDWTVKFVRLKRPGKDLVSITLAFLT
jgi:hypothetical protein